MAQRSHIPAFGEWEGSNNVPFTQHFDNARKGRVGGKPFNPNDPEGNSPLRVFASDHGVPKTKEAPNAHAKIASRTNKGSEHIIEGSPNHLHHQVVDANKVSSGSPARGKSQPEGGHGHGSSTPERSRMKPYDVSEEKSEKSYVVPQFGTWDASDPSTADEYSDIFNKVREDRKAPKVPIIKTDPDLSVIYPGQAKRSRSKSWWSSCFGWCKK